VTHLPRSQTHTSSPTVYFVFLFETAQTALTGVDIYYWFMAGFGDLKGFKNYRYSHIDISMMDGIISFIVQLFFCYRIYTLHKRLWWLCTVIAVVSLVPPDTSRFPGILTHNTKVFCCSSDWRLVGRSQGEHYTTLIYDLTSNPCLREGATRSSQHYMYVLSASFRSLTGSQLATLVVVRCECVGGRPGCSGDGLCGTQLWTSESSECQFLIIL
jgi:hypothetical protein